MSLCFYLQTGYFEFFGDGYCLDETGNDFDYMRYDFDSEGEYDAFRDEWGASCKKTSGFRGFSIHEIKDCFCWYEDGQVASDTSPHLNRVYTDNVGTGPVYNVRPIADAECYIFEPN
jgi:hypothetical protein